jgi:hypothetical protein
LEIGGYGQDANEHPHLPAFDSKSLVVRHLLLLTRPHEFNSTAPRTETRRDTPTDMEG